MKSDKEKLEKQFSELHQKAEKEYSDINQSIATMNHIVSKTKDLQDYFSITTQAPLEFTNNKIQYP